MDIRNGLIALAGWKKQTNISALDFVKEIENFGVSRIIYTDINRDGTKKGPNVEDVIKLSIKVKIPFIISGGIASIEDVKKIKMLSESNIQGVIIGKAIYDGNIKIRDLIKLI
jgi:phosphoribosylformimino-5-aminoimidazole carboxamide ribotide isomerase